MTTRNYVGAGWSCSMLGCLLFLSIGNVQDMPEAAGAVAAAAVADRLLGPKERRQLAIVLVSEDMFVNAGQASSSDIYLRLTPSA